MNGRILTHQPARSITALVCLAAAAPASAQTKAAEAPKPNGPPTELKVTERGTVRMHVAEMPLPTVLHLLSLESQRNIIASPQVRGNVTANLYDATFDEALEAVLIANGAGYRTVGNFVYVYTNEELAKLDAAQGTTAVTAVYRLNYVSSAEAKSYLEPIVGKDGSVTAPPAPATGLKSDAEEGGGNASAAQDFVVVTAPAAVQHQVATVLRQIDVRPKQVLIEATILRAQLNEDNALGIDFTLVGGVDLALLDATSNGIGNLTLGNLPPDRLELFNSAATTDFRSDVPAGGLTFGVIKDKVGVFLRALEEVTDTTVLANPKLLALNKQKAQVIVGRRDGFYTTTVTETQAIQTVQFLETGTQLIFRPFVGDDGFIRVELHPEDSVGFVSAQGLPTEQTTEVTTNVIVRDGETILIGGLFREVTTDAKSQIPALGGLPGVGPLFRSKNDTSAREEVIILLTMHLVKDNDAYARASKEQAEAVERLRVGVRQGLMWTGRERLTQAHYRQALDALSAGDRKTALWHLNLVLHNQPQFLPAATLKEQILEQRAWDDEGSGGRAFLHTLINREKGYNVPPFGRPKPTFTSPADPPPAAASEPLSSETRSQSGDGT